MKYFILLSIFVIQVSFGQSVRPFFSHSFEPQPSTVSPMQDIEYSSAESKKNIALAVTLSLIVPGLGEYYVGNYSTGKYFTIAEGALWLTWGSFRGYSNWIRNDSRDFAVQHAGVSPDQSNTQYFIDIGDYLDVHTYNEQMLLDRESITKLYDPNSNDKWNWDSDASRKQYRTLRIQSDNVSNNANFVIAAIVVNHLLSAIDAGRMALRHNKAIDEAGTLNFHASPLGTLSAPNGIQLSAVYHF